MNKKRLALYGLKWNPFAPEVPGIQTQRFADFRGLGDLVLCGKGCRNHGSLPSIPTGK